MSGGSDDTPSVTEKELKYIVESIEEEGVLEESESEMVRSALDFDEKTVEEILTPRVDVTFINVDDSQEKIKNIIIENRYSRIPIYEETVDNIVGVLHTRDYLESLANGKAPAIRSIMQTPFFVFRTTQLSKVLNSFKRTKLHLAVVTDEYGGTLGIVTMEDILEELVGDIWDEHDEVVEDFKEISEDTCIVDCSLNFYDFCAHYDIESDTNSISLGGWITEQMGKKETVVARVGLWQIQQVATLDKKTSPKKLFGAEKRVFVYDNRLFATSRCGICMTGDDPVVLIPADERMTELLTRGCL
jgi:CBS domain containing-hemolysin-like protein